MDDKIFSYLNGELSPAEAAEVEAALQADPALASEVQFYRDIMDAGSELPLEPVPMELTVSLMDAAVDELRNAPRKRVKASFWDRVSAMFAQPALVGSMAVVMVGLVSVAVYKQMEKNQPDPASKFDDSFLQPVESSPSSVEPTGDHSAATPPRTEAKERADSEVNAPVRATGMKKTKTLVASRDEGEKEELDEARAEGSTEKRVVKTKRKLKRPRSRARSGSTPNPSVGKPRSPAPSTTTVRMSAGAPPNKKDMKPKPSAKLAEREDKARRGTTYEFSSGAVAEEPSPPAASRPSARPEARDDAKVGAGYGRGARAKEQVVHWRDELRRLMSQGKWAAANRAANRWMSKNQSLKTLPEFQVLVAEILLELKQPSLAAKRAKPHKDDARYGKRARKVLEKAAEKDVGSEAQ